jgi:GNAT superfamily N-acetyltransferase
MSSEPQRLRDAITVNGVEITDTYLHLIRPSLADLADPASADAVLGRVQLPPGYRFRTYRPGDRDVWMDLLRAAEPFFVIPDNLFEKDFSERLDALADRMFFVETDGGEPVGTTTAWWQPDWRESGDWAQIHWVAVHPAHQGRGLSKPLVNRALRRLARSHERAMLGTSTGRVWAIKVYLDYGFVPDPQELNDEKIVAAWRELHRALPHPALDEAMG